MEMHPRVLDYTQSDLDRVIPDEAELTAGTRVVPGRSYGFFTDTTVCIGCKACEVACKEWNNLPADHLGLTGDSYDNTGALSANTWRHVNFIEPGVRTDLEQPFQSGWLMMSDVCKHCHNAPCLEACPTGALFRTEFDTVVVQQDICNGCGYCVPACPFGVVDVSALDGKAHKCTLCYDRLKGGLEPACAKACPTDSIQFGELADLHRPCAQTRGAPARTRRRVGLSLRHARRPGRDRRAGPPQRVLPADRIAGNLQPARRAHPPGRTRAAEPGRGVGGGCRTGGGRLCHLRPTALTAPHESPPPNASHERPALNAPH